MKVLLDKITNGEKLNFNQSYNLLSYLLTKGTVDELAFYLSTINTRGETYEELKALTEFTKKHSNPIEIDVDKSKIIDVSGTGGSSIKTINVSTISALIMASLGYIVPKQSNYAGTGITGSADIFKSVGIDIFNIDAAKLKPTSENVGICPYFSPMLNKSLRKALNIVVEYFIKTEVPMKSIFHLAAFTYSPIKMTHRVYGCFSKDHLKILSRIFHEEGYKKTAVLHGHGGLPEVSTFGETTILWQNGNSIKKQIVEPKDFGIQKCNKKEIESFSANNNLSQFIKIIYGKEKGVFRDLCLVNAAVALVVVDKASNLKEAVEIARSAFENGLVKDKFEELVSYVGSKQKLKKLKNKFL